MALGVPQGQTFLVPHDPQWFEIFEEESRRLRSLLPLEAVEIQHVGSTAVPGLRAKPIIDIAIAATDHRLADEWQAAMSSLGYDYPGDIGIPGHRIFGRDPGMRRFLVHVVDADGQRWRDLLRFRDSLRRDPQLAAAYEDLKEEAALRHGTGPRGNYTSAKAEFIERVLAQTPRDSTGPE
jgi:GrpB-like predicted nucleotidyltransferase (UPF0157 family)